MYHRKKHLNRPVVVRLAKEIAPHEVKNNLRTAGIGRERYLELLKKKRKKRKTRPKRGK